MDARRSSRVQEKSKYSCHERMMKLHVQGVHSRVGFGSSNVDIRATKATHAALLKKPACRGPVWCAAAAVAAGDDWHVDECCCVHRRVYGEQAA